MVFTLQRYVFRELLRVFLLATVGLTLILSLGGILEPVQEYGAGPWQVGHILLYFLPITLTFVLPMAALFAAALTYGRFAVDNELDACRASGVSLLTLIYPGFVLAILVAIANLLLSFHVMPYFVHLAEKSLKADAKQILFRNIQRRGYYRLPPDGRYLVYADDVDLKENTLSGIIVVQHDKGRIKRIITSEVTQVQFDPHDRFNEVQLTIHNARQMADDYCVETRLLPLKKEFGSLLEDDIKFKKVEEMKQIRGDLMRFDPVAKTARTAYTQLATELLAGKIAERWRASPGSFYELQGPSGSIRLSARACALDKQMVITLMPPVVVEEYDRRAEARRRLTCADEQAQIYVEEDAVNPRLGLYLHSAREGADAEGSLLTQHTITDLTLPAPLQQSLEARPLLEAVLPANATALLGASPSSILAGHQKDLVRLITNALIDIKAEMNSRLVFGVGCIPMILIGIGLGILQRGGHLLGAFGVSCLPAVLLVVAIVCGKHITENVGSQGPSGVLIMWTGLGFLALLTIAIYRRLLRR